MADRVWITWDGYRFAFDEPSQYMMQSFLRHYERWAILSRHLKYMDESNETRGSWQATVEHEYSRLTGMYIMMAEVIEGCPRFIDLINGQWEDEITD